MSGWGTSGDIGWIGGYYIGVFVGMAAMWLMKYERRRK